MKINIEKFNKKNICFTGMMGAGKSVIGRQFAKTINYGFVDTDTLIEEAQSLLDLVGIGYLVVRDGGWNIVRKFEDELSLGEQQRLGMARLFFHNPSFAVLDECTDAVSVDVEERLYKAAVSKNIVCITISKRLALIDFHETELNLGGDNKDGFVVKKL